jgi:hypothetical protein
VQPLLIDVLRALQSIRYRGDPAITALTRAAPRGLRPRTCYVYPFHLFAKFVYAQQYDYSYAYVYLRSSMDGYAQAHALLHRRHTKLPEHTAVSGSFH